MVKNIAFPIFFLFLFVSIDCIIYIFGSDCCVFLLITAVVIIS